MARRLLSPRLFGMSMAVSVGLLVFASAPAWSVIAFSSDRCSDQADWERRGAPDFANPGNRRCAYTIWTMADDGSHRRRITDVGERIFGFSDTDRAPAFSPDGRWLVFERGLSRTNGAPRLWLAAADGSDAKSLTPVARSRWLYGEREPAWSPDGKTIAFSSDLPREGPREDWPNTDLFLFSAGGERRIALGVDSEENPVFSPDGHRLIFNRSPGPVHTNSGPEDPEPTPKPFDSGIHGLRSIALDGSREAPLVQGMSLDGWGVSFSADGRHIAMSIAGSIYTMGTDGSELTRRTPGRLDSAPVWASGPSLLFSREGQKPTGGYASRIVKLDLGQPAAKPRALTDGNSADLDPAWYPRQGLDTPTDKLPPAIGLLGGAGAGSSKAPAGRRSGARRPVVVASRKRLRYVAVDPSGVRRVSVSVAHAGRRTSFRRLRGGVWRRLVRRLGPGVYTLRFRTIDGSGNTGRGPAQRIRLR